MPLGASVVAGLVMMSGLCCFILEERLVPIYTIKHLADAIEEVSAISISYCVVQLQKLNQLQRDLYY